MLEETSQRGYMEGLDIIAVNLNEPRMLVHSCCTVSPKHVVLATKCGFLPTVSC
jgi:hypothetical protein